MDRGFSLIEALVASAMIASAIVSLAQLSTASIRWNRVARSTTMSAALALQKVEQLRALSWTFDAAGTPISDTTTDTTTTPERPTGGTGLMASPPGALDDNVSGYCDFLDAAGASLGSGSSLPSGAVFVRRWSIDRLPTGDALVIQVSVTPVVGSRHHVPGRATEEARLVDIKTRKSR